VPTPNVSLVDLTADLEKDATVEEVNAAMKRASEDDLSGILSYTEQELVSSDFKGDAHSSILDAKSTMVVGGSQVKVLSWYDNEWGYSCRVVDLVRFMGQKGYPGA
jgi:glyceraldehyde 3-phosphate dehydrogenase